MWRYLIPDLSHLPTEKRQVVLYTDHGTRRSHSSRRLPDNTSQQSHQLGKAFKCLADAICHRVLRNRTHGCSVKPVRFSTLRCRSISFQPKTSRFDDCCWTNFSKNDAGTSTDLSANDRTKMGHLDGGVCLNWRSFRYVCSRSRSRSIYARRHLRTRLPSTSRDAHRWGYGNTANYRRGQHSIRCGWKKKATRVKSHFPTVRFSRCHNKCVLNTLNQEQLPAENSNV